ncbi:MAG: DUF5686 family protein [Breznakibacter sp.]
MFLFLTALPNALAQRTTITGHVYDKTTNEAIGFVNVFFPKTSIGTVTDTAGYFKLSGTFPYDTVHFSTVGYRPTYMVIRKGTTTQLTVQMDPDIVAIKQVDVKPDDGPIRRLMNKVTANKDANNPDKLNRFTYEKYTRWEYSLNNVGNKLANSRVFRQNPSVFKTSDDSSRFLPVYFSEQLVRNEFQREPLKQKSTILADNTTGLGVLADYEISGYTSGLDIEVNFYDNFINLFTQNFVSPLADNGWFYYKYYLKDSTNVNGTKQYTVRFVPRRQGDKTFRGQMVIETNRFSLVEIDATLSEKGNINFLKKMRLASSYQMAGDSVPFFKTNLIEANIDYIPINTSDDKKRLEVAFKQVSSISKVDVNPTEPLKLSSSKLNYESVKQPGAYRRDSNYWQSIRHMELSDQDKSVMAAIDSINQIPTIKFIDKLAQMYMTGYYDVGRIELGPYDYFFNFNKVEGTHLFFGARTSSEISQKWMAWGGLGYGTRNQQFMGRLGYGYKFDTPTRQVAKIWWSDDIVRVGENEKILYLYENMLSPSESNLVSHLFKRDELDELQRQQKVGASYEHEWRSGFSSKFGTNWSKHFSPEFYPFTQNGTPLASVSSLDLNIDFRWSWKEKYIDNGFLRFYYSSAYRPIIHLTLGGGQTWVNDQTHPYARVHASYKHNVYLGQALLMYAFEGGAYVGKMPYSFLDIPRGNETYGFYTYDFNMMDYLEFVHDKYLHSYMEYHMNGFFFNRLPLLKKLGLREVVSAKAMVGSLNQHNNLIDLPFSTSYNGKPYLEVGAGVENILRFFRIDAVWRVAPKSQTGAPSFGIRGQVNIKL